MKKQIFLFILLLSCFSSSNGQGLAEQAKKDLVENSKFGGFVIGRAAFNDRDLSGANKYHSNFDLRLVRGYVDGKILNFQYKLQLEYEGYGGASEKGPHIVDAWGEWQKFKFFRIKLGQFKRCFTFENPTNPWDISFGGYSQLSDKLAGMNDRIGEHSSGGRDGGVQIQGDLLPSRKDGHGFVHYQIGLFNGQGINHNDVNNHKDLILLFQQRRNDQLASQIRLHGSCIGTIYRDLIFLLRLQFQCYLCILVAFHCEFHTLCGSTEAMNCRPRYRFIYK